MTRELINLNKDATIKLWMERVSACRASNLTVRAWCQQNDIPYSSYYHWQRKLFVCQCRLKVPKAVPLCLAL